MNIVVQLNTMVNIMEKSPEGLGQKIRYRLIKVRSRIIQLNLMENPDYVNWVENIGRSMVAKDFDLMHLELGLIYADMTSYMAQQYALILNFIPVNDRQLFAIYQDFKGNIVNLEFRNINNLKPQ